MVLTMWILLAIGIVMLGIGFYFGNRTGEDAMSVMVTFLFFGVLVLVFDIILLIIHLMFK